MQVIGVFGELFEPAANACQMSGYATGVVLENWDEKNPGKVKVKLSLGVEGKTTTGWIPVMYPYAGKQYGMYAHPEIGSLVVVVFHLGDRNCPLVIGSLYDGENPLPDMTAGEKNVVKKFKTKGGCELTFTDEEEKAKVEVHTPGNLSISIEDETKKIVVTDGEGENQLLLDADKGEISISAKKKIELKVDGNTMLSLDGSGKTAKIAGDTIKIEAGQTFQAKGNNTKLEGSMISITADSSLKIESSGMAALKGSMVKIN